MMQTLFAGHVAVPAGMGRQVTHVTVSCRDPLSSTQSVEAEGIMALGLTDSSVQLWSFSADGSELIADLKERDVEESEGLVEGHSQGQEEKDRSFKPRARVTCVRLNVQSMLLLVAVGLADGRALCWANGEELDGSLVATGLFALRCTYLASAFKRPVFSLFRIFNVVEND